MRKTPPRYERRMVREAQRDYARREYKLCRAKGSTRLAAWLVGYAKSRSIDWPWDKLTWLALPDHLRRKSSSR